RAPLRASLANAEACSRVRVAALGATGGGGSAAGTVTTPTSGTRSRAKHRDIMISCNCALPRRGCIPQPRVAQRTLGNRRGYGTAYVSQGALRDPGLGNTPPSG